MIYDIATPDEPDRPETVAERKAAFLDYQCSLSKYPEDEDHFHRTTRRYVEAGFIPWDREEPPSEYRDGEAHSSYFITVFIPVANECILRDEGEIRDLLSAKRENTPNRADYAQDGSYGQAKAARRIAIKTIEWFLCEWDGDYDPYDGEG